MNSRHKYLLPLAAIALIGLAGAPAAFAQAPVPPGPPKPAKYDLVANKKHEGSAYTLDVTNAGQAISPSGSIQVVELIPPGLTIAGIGAPSPWTCTGSFPMVGPDAFTCTYPINAVIPMGQHLPQIVLKTTGTPECPNCMRVHLYLKEVSGGQKPVEEGDMKNNASCAK
jgi:hypothetical protein